MYCPMWRGRTSQIRESTKSIKFKPGFRLIIMKGLQSGYTMIFLFNSISIFVRCICANIF